MKPLLMLVSLAVLANCGADGAPTPPEPKAKTGVSVSGEARIGVVFSG